MEHNHKALTVFTAVLCNSFNPLHGSFGNFTAGMLLFGCIEGINAAVNNDNAVIVVKICNIRELVSYICAFTGISFCVVFLIGFISKVIAEISINLSEFVGGYTSALFKLTVFKGGCICCVNIVVTCCNKELKSVFFFILEKNFSKTGVSLIFAVLCKVTGNEHIFKLRISSCHCFNGCSDDCFTLRVKLCAALAVILISRTVIARK